MRQAQRHAGDCGRNVVQFLGWAAGAACKAVSAGSAALGRMDRDACVVRDAAPELSPPRVVTHNGRRYEIYYGREGQPILY